ncbi:HD-GYP domain-containing protein [Candidatus Latescibacterota bacterium]
MVLGKSIYELDNRLMLAAGNKITLGILKYFSVRGYNYIYINEEGTEEVTPEDIISYPVLLQASSKLSLILKSIKLNKFRNISVEEAMKLIEEECILETNQLFDVRSVMEAIVNDISYSAHKILNTLIPKSKSTYFIDHAINTTILSTLIGYKYRLKKPELLNLAVGAFLHDIGKIIIEQLEGHDDDQTAQKLYREHPIFGYLMLQKCKVISPMENQIVYQHHENQDGTGFPSGHFGGNKPPTKYEVRDLKGQIYRLAEICSVANAYDRMVLNPYDEEQLTPRDVIKKLIPMVGTILNKDIVKTLIQIVPIHPIGAYVKVVKCDDPSLINYYGIVAEINEGNLNKPIIYLMIDNNSKRIDPFKIDTSQFDKVKLELIL